MYLVLYSVCAGLLFSTMYQVLVVSLRWLRWFGKVLLSGIEQATPPKPSGRGGVPEYNGPGPEHNGSLKPESHPGEKYPLSPDLTFEPVCQLGQFSPSAIEPAKRITLSPV